MHEGHMISPARRAVRREPTPRSPYGTFLLPKSPLRTFHAPFAPVFVPSGDLVIADVPSGDLTEPCREKTVEKRYPRVR